MKRQDLSFIRGFLYGIYSITRVVKVWNQNKLVIRLLLTVGEITNGIYEYAINAYFVIENE